MKKRSGLIWVIVLAVLIIAPFMLVLILNRMGTGSLVERHRDEIVDERGGLRVSSSASDQVQRENGSIYYLRGDDVDQLIRRKGGEDTCLIEGVYSFLVDGENIFYTKKSEKNAGIYCRKIGSKEETKVTGEKVRQFVMGSGQNFACTDDRLIRFDTQWRETGSYDFKKKSKSLDGGALYGSYGDDFLVFWTLDDLYVYSIPDDTMTEWEVPVRQKSTENVVSTDLKVWEGQIYYLSCQYEEADLQGDLIEDARNGVYRMDFETKKLEKVSDRCGDWLLNLEDGLYIAEQGVIFPKLKKVNG